MKNEEYEMGYKYGRKIGRYEVLCEVSINCFDMVFEKELNYKMKRIKWLSNCELEVLQIKK